MPELAFLSLGSNIDPERNLILATSHLSEIGRLLAISEVYQTAAIGPRPAPDFLNAAALVKTELAPQEIRTRLRQIEARLGRVRTQDRYAPRPIDLDLCLLGNQVVETPELRVPDPDLLTRPYLAVTLAELAPDFVHPVTGDNLAAIARRVAAGATLLPRPDVSAALRQLISGQE